MQGGSGPEAAVRRYKRARAARRPLRLSRTREVAPEPLYEIRTGLTPLLRRLADGSGRGKDAVAPELGELAELTERLDAYEAEICSSALAISLPQLRAAFPAMRQTRPQEVEALLDLLVERETLPGGIELIDYLVTLLASEEGGGRRELTRDPAALTPELARRSEELATADVQIAEDRLAAAAERAHDVTEIDALIEEMRSFKGQLGEHMFAPAILRAMVRYNLAVEHRLATLLEMECILDEEEVEMLAAEAERLEPDPPECSPMDPAAPSADFREEIELALVARLQDRSFTGSPAAEIVTQLDLTQLGARDRGLFLRPEPDPVGYALCRAILIGLLVRQVEELETPLVARGISAEQIRGPWFDEARDALRKEVQRRLEAGDYAGARPVADVLACALPPRLGARKEAPKPKLGPEWEARFEPHSTAAALPESPRASLGRRRGRRRLRERVLVAAAIGVLVIGLGWRWHTLRTATVVDLSQDQLQTISRFLETGARDGRGSGGALRGTLDPTWLELAATAQTSELASIERTLRQDGVREALFFDRDHRLLVHYSAGRIRFPPR